jgi:hypothetical protein
VSEFQTKAALLAVAWLQGDQMRLWKISKNVPQPIFVKNNTQLLPRDKVEQKFGLL